MMALLRRLAGKKTYLIAAAMAVYAAFGYTIGHLPADEATRIVFDALAFAGLRAGVTRERRHILGAPQTDQPGPQR